MLDTISNALNAFYQNSGFAQLFIDDNYKFLIMIVIALFLMWLAIAKKFEPLFLLPISFGILLANLPNCGIMNEPVKEFVNAITSITVDQNGMIVNASGEQAFTGNILSNGGFLYYLSQGSIMSIFLPLMFLCIGALTDFSSLIANPKYLILGAGAQFGIFIAFVGALLFGFDLKEAASIATIGSANGSAAIYASTILNPALLSRIAITAYLYIALIPIIQPPIMRALTTKKERAIQMNPIREVSQREKILFPIITALIIILLLPDTAPLIGMLMLGNLFRESGITQKLAANSSEAIMYILSILIGIAIGATTRADQFLELRTLIILGLGLIAFIFSTAFGIIFGNIMCKLTGYKVNPLIGAAGICAVPVSAKVVQQVCQEENPSNSLLAHAIGSNVAGIIGSIVATGIFLSFYK